MLKERTHDCMAATSHCIPRPDDRARPRPLAHGTAKRLFPSTRQAVRAKWQCLDGRRVRLWVLFPKDAECGAWPDAATHPPLLLLHGLGCSAQAWEPTLHHLARRGCLDRPVYAVDLPGFGRSQGPRRALGVTEL